MGGVTRSGSRYHPPEVLRSELDRRRVTDSTQDGQRSGHRLSIGRRGGEHSSSQEAKRVAPPAVVSGQPGDQGRGPQVKPRLIACTPPRTRILVPVLEIRLELVLQPPGDLLRSPPCGKGVAAGDRFGDLLRFPAAGGEDQIGAGTHDRHSGRIVGCDVAEHLHFDRQVPRLLEVTEFGQAARPVQRQPGVIDRATVVGVQNRRGQQDRAPDRHPPPSSRRREPRRRSSRMLPPWHRTFHAVAMHFRRRLWVRRTPAVVDARMRVAADGIGLKGDHVGCRVPMIVRRSWNCLRMPQWWWSGGSGWHQRSRFRGQAPLSSSDRG